MLTENQGFSYLLFEQGNFFLLNEFNASCVCGCVWRCYDFSEFKCTSLQLLCECMMRILVFKTLIFRKLLIKILSFELRRSTEGNCETKFWNNKSVSGNLISIEYGVISQAWKFNLFIERLWKVLLVLGNWRISKMWMALMEYYRLN